MIEISDRKYWKDMRYNDGLLYCQLLDIDGKNDWRMISKNDWIMISKNDDPELQKIGQLWFIEDGNDYSEYFLDNAYFWIVPIRNLSS